MDILGEMPGIVKSNSYVPQSDLEETSSNCEGHGQKVQHLPSLMKSEEPDVPEIVSQPSGACADFLFIDSMLNHLAKSQKAPFKSQQVGDPDLDFSEKKEIARDILKDNPARFLAKFGHYLLEDHLDYFSTLDSTNKNYEVDFHVKQLRRFLSKAKNQVDVRNRRFEALKKLMKEGDYFSEEEMKKRNPLMYEQLIGQYLTPQERQDRYANKKQSRSYVVHLMGQIEDHYVNCLKKQQLDDEEAEEMDTSDEEVEENEPVNEGKIYNQREENEEDIEEFDTSDESEGERTEQMKKTQPCQTSSQSKVTDEEKYMFREEFFNNMYESFLEGRDTDFDYTTVDTNPEYECLAVRTQDEEEQYFDSETPELIKSGNITPTGNENEEEEEDELDVFMKKLNSESSVK
ncbi:hypothetical protein R5R35_009636 [Gryllus longicercus]|uniref:CCD97-like C-terminal domain-containing protein n=2 Tax=Gryllus longicercus TaxID=2509291 RepID=A0AAN9V773_9ORTH